MRSPIPYLLIPFRYHAIIFTFFRDVNFLYFTYYFFIMALIGLQMTTDWHCLFIRALAHVFISAADYHQPDIVIFSFIWAPSKATGNVMPLSQLKAVSEFFINLSYYSTSGFRKQAPISTAWRGIFSNSGQMAQESGYYWKLLSLANFLMPIGLKLTVICVVNALLKLLNFRDLHGYSAPASGFPCMEEPTTLIPKYATLSLAIK